MYIFMLNLRIKIQVFCSKQMITDLIEMPEDALKTELYLGVERRVITLINSLYSDDSQKFDLNKLYLCI